MTDKLMGRQRDPQPRCDRCGYLIWGEVTTTYGHAFAHSRVDTCGEIIEAAKEARGRVWDEVHSKVRAVALMLGLHP